MNVDDIAQSLGMTVKTLTEAIAEMTRNGVESKDAFETFRDVAQEKKKKREENAEVARKKAKEEEDKKIRCEENEILEKYRELIERRVSTIEVLCPRCFSKCKKEKVLVGGSRSEVHALSCTNWNCRYYLRSNEEKDCDWEPPLEQKNLKKRMFYDP